MPTTREKPSLLAYSRWASRLADLSDQYRENEPVPHIFLKGFLEDEVASAACQEFPAGDTTAWTHYQHQNENKHGMTKRQAFPPLLGALVDELNSPEFVSWLAALTGIPNLIADQRLEGGGLHQSGRGGFLNVHTDFSHHHYHQNWRRRVNLILYLNEGWQTEWGGAIELWDDRMRQCVAKYPPLLNQVLVFDTNEKSYHGFPEPLACPDGTSRKSLALYYYTIDSDSRPDTRSTNYRARPNDGLRKSALIWLDKQAVHYYSLAKARFGFSDDFASRVLGLISRKKTPRN
ncbi:MAG TPA: 2OG-Fe(II) oxygenase [Bryobacteraceae bacterium]|nr:2OG-Fe(II) oxygenase [Bryobacteraceae bacterium]